MAILFKVRITSPDPDAAELLRQALKLAFGEALTLAKARKGSNPKYAHLDQVLAYGELELSRAELEAAAGVAPTKKRATRTSRAPKAPAQRMAPPAAYTQQTIALGGPAKAPKGRKKVQP